MKHRTLRIILLACLQAALLSCTQGPSHDTSGLPEGASCNVNGDCGSGLKCLAGACSTLIDQDVVSSPEDTGDVSESCLPSGPTRGVCLAEGGAGGCMHFNCPSATGEWALFSNGYLEIVDECAPLPWHVKIEEYDSISGLLVINAYVPATFEQVVIEKFVSPESVESSLSAGVPFAVIHLGGTWTTDVAMGVHVFEACGAVNAGWNVSAGSRYTYSNGVFQRVECPDCPPDSIYCAPDCNGRECGPDGCGGTCGTCSGQDLCVDDACVCQSDCAGKECGVDGCGGSCGDCKEYPMSACEQSICTCSPYGESDCMQFDIECGPMPDGCGAEAQCGECECGYSCQAGACIVAIPCADKECGDDGCGGSCGQCQAGWQCGGNQQCFDPCEGKECGDDGYGGTCGHCPQGSACESGECKTVAWTDSTSGLTWQVTPSGGSMSWADAKSHCANLELAGGGWHLPTIGELRTMIRGCPATEDGGSCNVEEGDCLAWSCEDGSCSGCSNFGGPADGCYWPDEMEGTCSSYWSSSPVEGAGIYAWYVSFYSGNVDNDGVNDDKRVRCVR